jgi:hypothetical protein
MLKIHTNRRFLVYADGTSFFYLGDTAWELFHRLNREEAVRYLEDRAAKRFTVIQAVVLAECDGILGPNALGDTPLLQNDPTQPNEPYFAHVDYIVERAAALGLYIGMLPTWGDKWNKKWGAGPEIFTPENAHIFGQFLGRRYRDQPLIWILGGDRPVETEGHRSIIRAMAEGLREGDGGAHLISFHPMGGHTSSEYFHDQPWLDFNMWQSGHNRNRDNYAAIAADYALTPTKPCMDAEPGYEDHMAAFNPENGYLDDYDVRKSLYWALFAGAHGHTYGCHPIWQMWRLGLKPISWVRRPWDEALSLPGAGQMQHARALLLSRPFFSRIPDQALIVSDVGAGTHHIQATRDEDRSYAFVYVPMGTPVEINLEQLSGATLVAHWYNPRTGTAQRAGSFPRVGTHTFTPPAAGPDWVLTLDDAARHFPPLGAAIYVGTDVESTNRRSSS